MITALVAAAALLLPLGALAIYPDGHFNHVTEITSEEKFVTHIQSEINADKTLFVRWMLDCLTILRVMTKAGACVELYHTGV